jgi:acyl-CoA reductase-like NAD-dependent aldehyde dehydrogenase
VLRNLTKQILAHKNEIALASCRDSGKTLFEAYLGEVLTTCEKVRYICEYGEEALQPESRRVPLALILKKAQVQYSPLGVIGMIVPWSMFLQYLLTRQTILSTILWVHW